MYKKYKLIKKVQESNLVFSFYLEPLNGEVIQPFLPGQHLMFKLEVPGTDIPLFRYYSFSEAYNGKYYRVSVKKEGVCSAYLCDDVRVGDILEAKGPQGEFSLDAAANHPVALFAGGIGITPLLCMAQTIINANPQRRVALFYGVNDREQHSFKDELRALKTASPAVEIHTFYNNIHPDDVAGADFDYHGFIDLSVLHTDFRTRPVDYYLCGPGPMMQFITEGLISNGISEENIYTESFTSLIPPEEIEEGIADAKESAGDGKIRIAYKQAGVELEWDSRYRSILEFSEANNIEIISGCMFGDCGTCLTSLLKGEIKYTHPIMIEPDEGDCLPCSCIPLTNIELDA